MEGSRPVLAVDIGGTKLAAGLVEPGGRVLTWSQVPTPADLDAEQLWRTLDALLTGVLDEARVVPSGLAGCGCGCGGPMEWPAGRVSPLNIPAWRNFPLRDRLAERLDGIPVHVHNDAICLVAGEHWRGAGRGRSNVLGMVVSTGVGGGLRARRPAGRGCLGQRRSRRPRRGGSGHRPGVRLRRARLCRGNRPRPRARCLGPVAGLAARAARMRPPRSSPLTERPGTRSASPRCAGLAGPSASRSRRQPASAIWRWCLSAAGCRRPVRCSSIRWRRPCERTPDSGSRGRSASCRPRSGKVPGWSAQPR